MYFENPVLSLMPSSFIMMCSFLSSRWVFPNVCSLCKQSFLVHHKEWRCRTAGVCTQQSSV